MISNSLPIDAALRTRAQSVIPGGMYGHLNVARLPAWLSAVLRPRRRRHPVGRRRQRLCRLHVRLRPDGAGLRQSRGRSRRRCAAQAGRRADRPVGAAGRAGGKAGRHGGPCRLGVVPEERHRCHDALRRDRPGRHQEAQDPGGARRLSRLRAVVHAASRRHDRRGSRPPGALRLQRRRQPAGRGSCRPRATSRASASANASATASRRKRVRTARWCARPGRRRCRRCCSPTTRRSRRAGVSPPRRCAAARGCIRSTTCSCRRPIPRPTSIAPCRRPTVPMAAVRKNFGRD